MFGSLSILCQQFLYIYAIRSRFLQLEINDINSPDLKKSFSTTTTAIIEVFFLVMQV